MKYKIEADLCGSLRTFEVEVGDKENVITLAKKELARIVKSIYSDFCQQKGLLYQEEEAEKRAQEALLEMRISFQPA